MDQHRQHLFIVARDRSEVYGSLNRNFTGMEGVEVVLDRRQVERRLGVEGVGVERRRDERRTHQMDADLNSLGFAVMSGPRAARPRALRVASISETAYFLADVPLFKDFTLGELAAVAGQLGEQTLKQGQVLFYEGERGEEMFLVRHGTISISKALAGGAQKLLAVLARRDFFGEMSLFSRLPRSATARAESDAILIGLDRETLQYLLETNQRGAVAFLAATVQEFIERLRHTNDLAAEVTRWGLEPIGLDVESQ